MNFFLRINIYIILLLFTANFSFAERGIKRVANSSINSEQRVALVIGNGAYKNNPLKNPPNDAQDMAIELEKFGFTVTKLVNGSQSQMRKAIRLFGHDLKKGGVGIFFYAGHGMQVKGVNYLIPIGADIQSEDEVQDYAVDGGMILRKMQSAENLLNMVFLDACRNNPFVRSFRSSQKGLSQMDAPSGSMIAYATAPGKTAADGNTRNGTFTKYLLRRINNSNNVELAQLMKKVGKDVQTETNKKQVPWVTSSITGDFYFSSNSSFNSKPVDINDEEELWKAIRNSESLEDFEDYNELYPNGRFFKISKIKIRNIKNKNSVNYSENNSIEKKQTSNNHKMKKVKLTVRSNVLHDVVHIDDKPYGSTRIDVELPIGRHTITVKKNGFSLYTKEVNLHTNTTIKAELHELANATISYSDFEIDKYPTDGLAFSRCVDVGVCDKPSYDKYNRDPGYSKEPAMSITWQMAQDYCKWIGKRLPTLDEYKISWHSLKWRGCCARGTIPREWVSDRSSKGDDIGIQVRSTTKKLNVMTDQKNHAYDSTTVRCAKDL